MYALLLLCQLPPLPAPVKLLVTSEDFTVLSSRASEAASLTEAQTPVRAVTMPAGVSLAAEQAQAGVEPSPWSDWQTAMWGQSIESTGLRRLASPPLMTAAQNHAEHLARKWYSVSSKPRYAHDGYGDGTPQSRAAAAGFTGSLVTPNGVGGEVAGPSTSGDLAGRYGIFTGWMNSAGHRAAMTYPGFDVCGFGHAINPQGQHVFIGMFGSSKTTAVARSETGAGSSYSKPLRTLPTAFYSCPGGVCGQAIPQQYQRRGLFGRVR